MRIMAVDYGDARVGVAVSDISRKLTGDAWVLSVKSRADIASVLTTEAVARHVSVIVVGHPRNMDGTVGPRALISEQFAEQLRGIIAAAGMGVEVVLWDERMTTMSAHRILTDAGKFGKKRKNTVDAVAASLILESYMQSLS